MAVFPVVKGTKLRATKVNSCGLPQDGAGNYVVTDGWVSLTISPVMQEAEELEQRNAEGRVCVFDRTPPERKYYNLTLTLCQVNTCLISLFTSWEQVLDWEGNAVGFRDQREVEADFGVALEVWAGGRAAGDCPTPENDDVFNQSGTGREYGYMLVFGTEFVLGDIELGAQVSTFTLTGITFPAPQWGLGPWNVEPADAINTPRRLTTGIGQEEQFRVFRTPVPPPDNTPGTECCPLDIANTFVDPDFYFGGPAGEPPADVAPDQPECGTNEIQQLAITGSPTAGTFVLTYDGEPTSTLSFDAAAADVQTALEALTNIGAGNVTVTGGPMPDTSMNIEFTGALAGTDVSLITGDGSSLTGGTDPTVEVTVVQEGGQPL